MQHSRRILIVDDEDSVRTFLHRVFETAGYDVQTAANGIEAKRICESNSFDLLLSDIRMPVMNGHELARWIVPRDPATRVILMSGYDDLGCEGCGVVARPCSFVAKPFKLREVVALVGELLENTLPL